MVARKIITQVGIVLIIGFFGSCQNARNTESVKNQLEGRKINMMAHAVTSIQTASLNEYIKPSSEYKILTYINLYCAPCWQHALQWNENVKYFKDNPNVSLYFYIHASTKDFELRNADAQFDFPIFLDTRQRFRIVNQLGIDPKQLTFLLNKDNEILLVGPPFSEEMREKYLSIISKSN